MKLESNLQTATKSTLKLKVRDVQTPISKIIKTPHFTAKGFHMRTTKTSKCPGSVAEEVQCFIYTQNSQISIIKIIISS